MVKNANFEPPYKCFFREIPMFGFTRKKYHYGTTFIYQKNLEKWNQGLPAKFIGCPYCEPEEKIKKKFF